MFSMLPIETICKIGFCSLLCLRVPAETKRRTLLNINGESDKGLSDSNVLIDALLTAEVMSLFLVAMTYVSCALAVDLAVDTSNKIFLISCFVSTDPNFTASVTDFLLTVRENTSTLTVNMFFLITSSCETEYLISNTSVPSCSMLINDANESLILRRSFFRSTLKYISPHSNTNVNR